MKHLGVAVLTAFLLVSCGPSLLLDTVQKEVEEASTPLARPLLTPEGGMFRGKPPMTITNQAPGATVFFSFDQNPLVYSKQGQTGEGTYRADISPFGLGNDLFPGNIGFHSLQAVAWKDGKVSAQSSVSFGIVGDGGARWARAGFGTSGGEAVAVVQNAYGSIITGGWMRDNQAREMGVVTRWGNGGDQQWMVPIVSDLSGSTSKVTGLATDTPGNLYAVGFLSTPDTYHFGNGRTLTVTQKSGFLAKFDQAGACLWAVQIKATGLSLECTGVAISKSTGTIYISGWVDGTGVTLDMGNAGVGFVNETLPANKGTNAFLARYDSTGQALGAYISDDVITADASDKFYAVAIDEAWGRVVMAGEYRMAAASPSLVYAGMALPVANLGVTTALVISVSLAGAPLFASTPDAGETAPTSFRTVVAANGKVAAGGVQVGPSSRTWGSGWTWQGQSLGENAVLVGFDNLGGVTWVRGLQGTGESSVNGLAIGLNNFLYAFGKVGSPSAFWPSLPENTQGSSVSPPSILAPFAVRLDPITGLSWGLRTSAPGSAVGEYRAAAPGTFGGESTLQVVGVLLGNTPGAWGVGVFAKGPSLGENPLLVQLFD